MNWSSFVFAHTLKALLRHGVVETPDLSHFLVRGTLDVGAVLARIEIHVCQNFAMVIRKPPRVWCGEPWMRDGADWHNDRFGGMCWVLEDEWRDVLDGDGKQPRDQTVIGTTWLMNNVRSLVSRHYYAHLMRLKDWPKAWDAWAHYDKGAKQYERAKQSK